MANRSPAPPVDREDVSVFDLLTPLVRRRRLIVFTALGCALFTAIIVLIVPPRYTALTTFMPEAPKESSLSSSLGGLANQFGLGTQIGTAYSPDFMADVLRSRGIREALLAAEFPDPRDGTSRRNRPLIEILEAEGSTPARKLEAGLDALADATNMSLDRRTGVVSLRITLQDPGLAAQVANRMVEELNKFNVERRRSQSGEERIFTERRLQEVRKELADAEDELVRFLQRNRQFSEFSVASVGARSLERRVQLKQEVLATMSRSYEEARINEVRDTPVLTVIDRAEPPAWKSFPKRTISVLVALVVGTVLGMGLAYLAEARRRVKPETRPDYREFLTAVGEARGRKPAPRDVG
jgi:tyrosine-protein kinase Etk/Wzc